MSGEMVSNISERMKKLSHWNWTCPTWSRVCQTSCPLSTLQSCCAVFTCQPQRNNIASITDKILELFIQNEVQTGEDFAIVGMKIVFLVIYLFEYFKETC